MTAAENPCAGLAHVVEQYEQNPRDALGIFARVHHCICSRVQRWASGPTSVLNACFAKVFVDIHTAYVTLDLDRLPRKWVQVLSYYDENPENFVLVLPRMANAHIWYDLRSILAKLPQEVPKNEYDKVNLDIISCLRDFAQPRCETILDEVVNVIYVGGIALAYLGIPDLRERVYILAQRDRAEIEERIRQRAYQFASERGFVTGQDWEDWLRAEKEIRGNPC